MSSFRTFFRPLAPFAVLTAAAGCAPAVATMRMPNPALSQNAIQATQSYEVPPYPEDHRYEATLGHWAPSAIELRIHLVNVDRCALPSTYAFDLVDDRGRRYAFHQTGAPRATTAPGHLGATLNDVVVTGTFDASIDASTRYVLLQVRPHGDRACTALDFRWDFAAS
jgi:hypothetical protein